MMDFETWNRDTLIKEIKAAIMQTSYKSRNNSLNLRINQKLYSDIELQLKTDYELRCIYIKFKILDDSFRQQYELNEEKKAFFNQPESKADFDYWSKQAYWSIDEAVALALGKDPRKVTRENLKPYLSTSPFVKKFHEICEMARRYVNCKELFDPVFPGVFLAWAKRMEIEIPDQLLKYVAALGIQICDWQTLFKQSEGIIQIKDQTIQNLTQERDFLKSENMRLSEASQLELDPDHDDYSTELDTANIIYRMIINNRDDALSFKEQAKQILDVNYSKLSQDAKERIAVVINPDKQKLGGRKKQTVF